MGFITQNFLLRCHPLSYSSVASGILGATAAYVDDMFSLLLNMCALVAFSSSSGCAVSPKTKKDVTNRRIELLTFRFGI